MRVHQVLAGAAEGDAITRIALATRHELRRLGAAEVYAHHRDPAVEHLVRPIDELPPAGPEDVLVWRASIGDAEVSNAVGAWGGRVVVAYHNITPPEFFEQLDPAFAELLRDGRRQLAAARPRVDAAWADSTFNAEDLRSMGYDDVEVLPPLLDPAHLVNEPAAPGFALEIRRRAPAELILFVGQLLPHKQPHLLVAAHHLLTTHHRPGAALVVVGTPRFPEYARALEQYAAMLHLPRVWWTGPLPDRELAELYRRADVFVTASSHEGFCVPLLEAMAHSVPVVAAASGAIPETAGGAAVLLDDTRPAVIAEALDHVLGRSDRGALALAGRRRAAEFSQTAATARLFDFLDRRLGLAVRA